MRMHSSFLVILVLVTSSIDATSLFHSLSVGAEGSISGAVALAAAVSALAADVSFLSSPPYPSTLFHPPHVFLYGPVAPAYCEQPWHPDMGFLRLETGRLRAVLDVTQVGHSLR